MSVLLQRTERAIWSYLRNRFTPEGGGTELLELVTHLGEVIVTDLGLTIVTTAGSRFDVPLHVGQSEDVLEAPSIVVVAEAADEPPENWGTGNHNVSTYVEVRYPGDSWSGMPDVNAAMEEVSDFVMRQLYDSDFAAAISSGQESFTCMGVIDRGGVRRTESRIQIHQYRLTLYCSPSTIPREELTNA